MALPPIDGHHRPGQKSRRPSGWSELMSEDLATEISAVVAWNKELQVDIEQLRAEFDKLRTLVLVARDMRAAQRRYFKERTQSALVDSKRLEKELDRLLAAYQS